MIAKSPRGESKRSSRRVVDVSDALCDDVPHIRDGLHAPKGCQHSHNKD